MQSFLNLSIYIVLFGYYSASLATVLAQGERYILYRILYIILYFTVCVMIYSSHNNYHRSRSCLIRTDILLIRITYSEVCQSSNSFNSNYYNYKRRGCPILA